MTVDKFISDLEGYYSDTFAPAARALMVAYLAKKDADGLLPYLHAQVLKTYERTGGRIAPGIAELEKCKADAWAKKKSNEALARAIAAPDRLQITEDLADPQDIAAILGRLAAAKTVDGTAEGV
jgi:hypothetical protein